MTGSTVGELPPNIQAMTVDKEGRPQERRKQGEIWYKSPATIKGYCNDPGNTALTVTEDGWLKSGDIGWIDEQGYLYLVGRAKVCFPVLSSQLQACILLTLAYRKCSI